MSNILKAIINIANNPVVQLKETYTGRNTINNIGEALEAYIQDAFANTIYEADVEKRNQRISDVFSYLGNQNNPPDIILSGGDAIEVKKIQSKGSAIALNSSYPKSKLHSDDSKITDACRECEVWDTKDIIYAIGVKEIEDIEFAETKELGRINRVDPLGITNLRIRGMWHIDNPLKVYKDYYKVDDSKLFSLACIMRDDKFHTLDSDDKENILNHEDIDITDIKIKNPDNPANLINAKLITLEVS